MDLSIVCTLTEEELREHRRTLLDGLRVATLDITSTADGYAYTFKGDVEILSQARVM
jgi:hypothetical protein